MFVDKNRYELRAIPMTDEYRGALVVMMGADVCLGSLELDKGVDGDNKGGERSVGQGTAPLEVMIRS
jgi:hypothetical protein